jgi:3-oxoadipate enol-lactonase
MSIVDVVSSRVQDWLWGVKEEPAAPVTAGEATSAEPPARAAAASLLNDAGALLAESAEQKMPLKHQIDAEIEESTVTSHDGVELHCRVIRGNAGPANNGKGKVMLLCSPLGFSNIYVFRPLIAHFKKEYTYVNWDYRSLFLSSDPKRLRRCSIRDHAEDALDVLKAFGFECADAIVGHSMGVSVACEFTLLFPESVNSLILVNGGHGHVFSTAFQPFFRIPFVGNISEFIVSTLLQNNPKRTMEIIKAVGQSKPVATTLNLLGRVTGTTMMLDVHGESFWNEWISMYFGGLSADDKSAAAYCRLFQELNAHSTYHLLHLIEQPTLLVAGSLDYLTPPYLMKEMAREMPNAEYKSCLSTHLTLMENPEFVVENAARFLKEIEDGKRVQRCGSVAFRPAQITNEN